jgi:hypothetical protein
MDQIFFVPGGAAGAAVAYTIDEKTGSTEVDAKFNAAKSALVSAAAESHGQPGCVYRAMIVQEATLFRWKGADGKVMLGERAPAGASDAVELDTPKTVLAWTTEQAAQAGFGTMMTSSDVASLGPLLHASEWVSVGDGNPQMLRAQHDIERLAKDGESAEAQIKTTREKVLTAANRIVAEVKIAKDADPKKIQIFYRENGTLTPDSMTRWRQASETALAKWSNVLALIEDLQRAERKAAATVDEYNRARAKEFAARLYDQKWPDLKVDPVDHGIDIPVLQKEISDTKTRIHNDRNRNKV